MAGDDPWDLQAVHGPHIAGLMEGNNSIISRREKFRQVSCTWHIFWSLHPRVRVAARMGPSASAHRSRRRWMACKSAVEEVVDGQHSAGTGGNVWRPHAVP